MKKILLLAGFALLSTQIYAQERTVLYEEFTGENCPPCASANPGLMQLINNHDDVIIIKYQSPIPSGGPIYNQNTSDVQTRMSYYSVPFAPYGRIDGKVVMEPDGQPAQNRGHVGYTTSQMLNEAASVAPKVAVEIKNYARTLGSSTVSFDVEVTTLDELALPTVVLHVAALETLHFNTPPGTNGEKDFYNVVRKMYPGPQGQSVDNSVPVNSSQTFTYEVELPDYVDLNKDHENIKFVAFVQDNNNRAVLNATQSGFPVNIQDLLKETNIAVYPNPAQDILNIKLESPLYGEANWNIMDITGKIIYSSKFELNANIQEMTLDISKLSSGMYILQLQTVEGSKDVKFIKK